MWESATGWAYRATQRSYGKRPNPRPADVPGDGGCLFHSLTLEQRRLNGRPGPATAADWIKSLLALRLVANQANRHWIDGLSEENRPAAQRAVEGELVDGGRHTFTPRGAYMELVGKTMSVGTFLHTLVFAD